MQTIVNKTFKEIAPGDAATVQRTLQAGDVRAGAASFGDVDMLARPAESQAAAGIVMAILTALVGSALPGPGTSVRTTSVQIKGALPIGDDGANSSCGRSGWIAGSSCWTASATWSRLGGVADADRRRHFFFADSGRTIELGRSGRTIDHATAAAPAAMMRSGSAVPSFQGPRLHLGISWRLGIEPFLVRHAVRMHQCTASSVSAMPWPPPMQSVTTPRLMPSRCIE